MTAARVGGAQTHLREIRSHEGSQARAWEELAYQLRPSAGDDHVETRKTRAPDAGVEWYEIYVDGHQEGFQAKFHANLQDALSGMRESVEAVCTKRPNLTKLTFVVPYDFTDSGTASNRTDQDRWDEAVARWRIDFPGARHIEFATIRAGEITAKLAQREHAGRREYWFGELEITDEWLKRRFAESVGVAGERYTPQADSPSSINAIIDALSSGPTFLAELHSLAIRASTACRQDIGMWGASATSASQLIETLDGIRRTSFGTNDGGEEVFSRDAPDVDGLAAIANRLLELAYGEWETLPSYDRRNLDAAISALQALQTLSTSSAAKVLTSRAFALIGPAGQGKTHALMRAVGGCLERGVPALAILGQRLSDKNWWPAVAESVDFYVPTPELLGAARWVGHRAEWAVDGWVVARAIEFANDENGQEVLLVDAEWLIARLRDLDADMVIGTLSERHALPLDEDNVGKMAFSDVWYVALVTAEIDHREVGPFLKARRQVDEDLDS